MKRSVSFILAGMLAFSVTACDVQNRESENTSISNPESSNSSVNNPDLNSQSSTIFIDTLEAVPVKMNPDWSVMLSSTTPTFLSENEKKFYWRLKDCADEYLFSEKDFETYTYGSADKKIAACVVEYADLLSENEAREVLVTFWDNNPQFFFFDRSYSFETFGSEKVLFIVSYDEFINGKERWTIAKEIYDGLETLVNSIDKELPNAEKIELVVDKICEIAEPDMDAKFDNSVYGVMIDGRASCGGYAHTYSLIMNALGVDTIKCSSKEGKHIWSLSEIDGKYYIQDVVNLDKNPESRAKLINVSYETIESTNIGTSYILDTNFAINTRTLVSEVDYSTIS